MTDATSESQKDSRIGPCTPKDLSLCRYSLLRPFFVETQDVIIVRVKVRCSKIFSNKPVHLLQYFFILGLVHHTKMDMTPETESIKSIKTLLAASFNSVLWLKHLAVAVNMFPFVICGNGNRFQQQLWHSDKDPPFL